MVFTAASHKAVDNILMRLKKYTAFCMDHMCCYHPSYGTVQCFGRTGRLEDMDEAVQAHSVLAWMHAKQYQVKRFRKNMQKMLKDNRMINADALWIMLLLTDRTCHRQYRRTASQLNQIINMV